MEDVYRKKEEKRRNSSPKSRRSVSVSHMSHRICLFILYLYTLPNLHVYLLIKTIININILYPFREH